MLYTIQNKELKVVIDSVGAQLMSVQTRDSHEYLWQGDEKYWTGRAYNLFPVIGRMYDGKYTYQGTTYEMPPHGLIRKTPLYPIQIGQREVGFYYKSNEKTLACYPFQFYYQITYRLIDNRLYITTTVTNTDYQTIHFGVGGHPGFFVPMERWLSFEDYYVRFDQAKDIKSCIMSDRVLFTGKSEPYPLQDNKLPLSHSLFPVDALVLTGTGGRATIQTDKSVRRVTVEYPNMKYLGIWQKPNTDAPYICLEPWSMLPASENGMDDFETKEDIVHLPMGKTYRNTWMVEIV
jgi:galactose mutarotase-like enzyme